LTLSEREWKKELKEFGEATEKRFQGLEESLKRIGEQSSNPNPASNQEGSEMPLYKCKNGNCAFSTEDLDAFIDHKIAHSKTESKPAEEAAPPAPKKRHETVDDFLNCPECRPRFDQRYLKEGWTPPKKEPEKEEETQKKKRGLF